jgi:hypothetical protein
VRELINHPYYIIAEGDFDIKEEEEGTELPFAIGISAALLWVTFQ